MKRNLTAVAFFFLLLILFLIAGCNDEEINKDEADEYITNMVGNISASNLELTVNWMENYVTRFFLANNRRQIAFDIKNKFIGYGYSNTRIDSFLLTANWGDGAETTWQYNVIASLEGSATPGNIYIMGAHYDCVIDEGDPYNEAPGANDNASGVAGIIEVARVLKSKSFIPKSTIEFVVFAAEENELNGSGDFVQNAGDTNTKIVAMLNNDMIGYAAGAESTWTVNVADYTNSGTLRSDFVTCGQLYTQLNFAHDNSYNDEGDSYSFYQGGFKSIFIISNDEDNFYHTTSDIAGNCNFDFCREVTALSCAYLVQENK